MTKHRSCRLALAAVAPAWLALAAAGSAAAPPAVAVATVGSLGQVLVSANGRTLYHTAAEHRGGGVACTGACTVSWRPLVVEASRRPTAGAGVKATWLGTVRRPDGRMQVTYRGLPLYLFRADRARGEAHGEGTGGLWYALTPNGAVARPRPAAATDTTASSPGTGSAGTESGMSSGSTVTSGSSTGSASTSGGMPPPGTNPGMWCAANPRSCVNGVPVTGG